MANDLTPLITKILARGLLSTRDKVILTRSVNLDYSTEAKEKGDTIDVPISSAKTTSDVVPGPVPPDGADSTIGKVPISLDYWKKANFRLTDGDLAKIDANKDFIPMEMSEAFNAMVVAINTSLFLKYKKVYGYAGVAGTTPFASTAAEAIAARKVLNEQKAPARGRSAILDYTAEANALALASFADADKIGSGDVKISGEIGVKYGIWWQADHDIPTHTAGTLADGTANGAGAVGDLTISIASTAGGTVLAGDILSYAGHAQTYAVAADVTIGATSNAIVTFTPALTAIVADTAVVTLRATHVSNIVFHRDAFALAMRSPVEQTSNLVSKSRDQYVMADPDTGLVFRLEIIGGYKQTTWELDALWGVECVRPAYATRLAG